MDPRSHGLNHQNRAFSALFLFVLPLLVQRAGSTEYRVGGAGGWAVPNDPNEYNQWAEKNRFLRNDSLLFVYPPNGDSVLEVKREDFYSCNTKAPLSAYQDGNTHFLLNQSGPYYFISGHGENCLKNESLVVIVMAGRGHRSSLGNITTAPPAPLELAPNPPPPSVPENNTTSPPSPTAPEINTTSPPPSALSPAVPETPAEAPPPPPNGAPSSMAMGFVGSLGVLLGPTLLIL